MSQSFDAAALVENATGRAPDLSRIESLSETYAKLLGFVPPRIKDRLAITGVLDPQSMELQEAVRSHAMDTPVFEPKTTQLMIFAMLMMDLSDAALTHAIAARRCGASWEELQAAISLCFLFRGLPAANRGATVLAEAMQREQASKQA
jgi:alkylhydroperoxidase/carboxymuconolactone decarboxylase family protein YurZ